MASVAASAQSRQLKRKVDDVGLDEATTQVVSKKCRYCGCWSNSMCPWDLSGTVLSQWSPYLPWGRGKASKPQGDKCKPCVIVTWLSILCFCIQR